MGLLAGLILMASLSALPGQEADRQPAPRFSAKSINGETFNNESLKGKIILLDFWTTWCPYCREEQKIVDQMYNEFGSQGFVVLAINVGESKKTVKKYLEANPRACPVVLTGDTNLAAMYQANAYPIYVAIDRDGKIAGEQRGAGGVGPLRNLLWRAGLKLESPIQEDEESE